MSQKYLFITGGVLSSLGKGLTAAAIGMLLEQRGLSLSFLKLDPYLNVDPGTMNPFQHGEVYVTDDGAETDLDLGHYARFTKAVLTRHSNATSGQIYDTVIRKERRGEFLGNTVQVIPHVTDEIKRRIEEAGKSDVVFVEIGGTVGDIESQPFLEAIRQFRLERPDDCINIHMTYVPYIRAAGEVKTKPTQHSVMMLREIGIIPDVILCRCENPLSQELKDKISLFCSVPKERVFDVPDLQGSIYNLPLELHKEGLDAQLCRLLSVDCKESDIAEWRRQVEKLSHAQGEVTIGLVGKYIDHQDAYKSVVEALYHGGIAANVKVRIEQFDSESVSADEMGACDGYLVPGGFGERGWEGKIATAQHCRERGIPYFGICLGMQVMAVEFARNVLGLADANSTEMDPETPYPIISLLSEQEGVQDLGGTMRLGAQQADLLPETRARAIYQRETIAERHRHRYEFNNAYKEECASAGLVISGTLHGKELCEVAELKDHPWMIGVQFHPEFTSRFLEPHPLFVSFIEACVRD